MRLPKSEWVLTPGAFEPIVDPVNVFARRRNLDKAHNQQSNEELLNSLRDLLASEGRLSLRLIQNSSDVPSPSTYRHRFGSLRRAYELIGYGRPDQFGPIDVRRRTQALPRTAYLSDRGDVSGPGLGRSSWRQVAKSIANEKRFDCFGARRPVGANLEEGGALAG